MKFTLSWLRDHLETTAPLNEIITALTALGLEVENVTDPAKNLDGFVVGQVIACGPHPDADRLQVTTVDTGTEQLQVVCGAPNCQQGLKGIFAPPGSYVPGIDLTLKKAKIRGQESNGMLCSEKELCLSDESAGIIELPDNTPIGMAAAEALGLNDPVIEINLTPDRADCAGVYGVARDLAAAGLGKLKPLSIKPVKARFKNPIGVTIKDTAKDACPLFLGRMIKGVVNGPSPQWLQNKLKAVGLRPISTLVDITNFLTMDLARPAHIFDADKLQGNIQVDLSQNGQTLEALDDKTYTLDDGMVAICDDSGVLGLGGIVGGISTGVTENTTNVYLEIAVFDPVSIATTGRKLQILSDARYRFERGVDPAFAQPAMEIFTKLVIDLCGGEASDVITAGQAPGTPRSIPFDPARTQQLGGIDIPDKKQIDILKSLGFAVKGKTVIPPSWRQDVEGPADLVEEVLRIYGYDKIEAVPLQKMTALTQPAITGTQQREILARRSLATRGLDEVVTWAFISSSLGDLFGANDHQTKAELTLINPISSDMSLMRPSILPGLVTAAQNNTDKGLPNAKFFELGAVYTSASYDGQSTVVAGIRTGEAVARNWASESRPNDAFDAKADALCVLNACGAPEKLQVTREAPDWYHPGRSGALRLGPTVLAYFGELHPGVLDEVKADGPVAAFEVFLDNIPAPKQKQGKARPPLKTSALQPVHRDFAFVVDEDVAAADLIRTAKAADQTLISDIILFDLYAGKGIEEGKKSLAITATLQPKDKTLTDKEIDAVAEKIVAAVSSKLGATLRA